MTKRQDSSEWREVAAQIDQLIKITRKGKGEILRAHDLLLEARDLVRRACAILER